jgi:hypothetical protein
MNIFGVAPDIDAFENDRPLRGRRKAIKLQEHAAKAEDARESRRRGKAQVASFINSDGIESLQGTSHVADATAIFDIDAHRGRLHSQHWNVTSDWSDCWDVAVDHSSKPARRQFFEQKIAANRWAELMGRPLRGCSLDTGSRTASGKENTHRSMIAWIDSVQREVGVSSAEAQRNNFAKIARTLETDQALTRKLCDALWNKAACTSADIAEQCTRPGSSRVSTASGGDLCGKYDASSPEIVTGTNTPETIDTEDEQRVDGAGHQEPFVANAFPVGIAPTCQSTDLPLALRRVMSAILPADINSSLQMSSKNKKKLGSLCTAVNDVRSPVPSRSARPWTSPRGKQ